MNGYLLLSLGLNICLILLLGLLWNRCRIHKDHQKKLVTLAAHELKTPLTIIKGYTEFLSNGTFGKLGEKQANCCQKINKVSMQGLSLIEKILTHQQKCAYELVKIKLLDFMNDMSDQLEGLCIQKNLTIDIKTKLKSPIAYFDEDQLTIVVRNLLSNAIKFSKKNQSIEIKITPDNNPKWLQISITNTGTKVPASDYQKIFKPWYTTDKSGSGLGLSIAQKIIKTAGGKIWIEDSNTQDTTLVFTIPERPKQ